MREKTRGACLTKQSVNQGKIQFAMAVCQLHYSKNYLANPFYKCPVMRSAYNEMAMRLIQGNKNATS